VLVSLVGVRVVVETVLNSTELVLFQNLGFVLETGGWYPLV
jgi:hypothetical protein